MKIKTTNLLLAIILLLGFILRVYKLGMADGWLYSVDVSKDILVGEHIIKYKEFTLAAPYAVGGQNFLKNSPLHYYFIAFFWLLTGSPVGVLFCGVVMGVITIFLAFLIGRELESSFFGLLLALFFAINDMLVMFSLLTIQPFYLSFFTVLTIYLLLKFRKKAKLWFLFWAVVSIWFGINIHYSFLQVFLCFNLLIVMMLIFDKKIKMVRGRSILVYGLSTLILMILWLVSSRNYEFIGHLGKMTSLMNGQSGDQPLWQSAVDSIRNLFGLVFLGDFGWRNNGWLMWIFILASTIFFVFLWITNRKIRWVLLSLLFLLSGYLMTITITDGINRNYFNTFVPILLILVIYLFYKMAKINLCFGLGLVILFYLSLNSDFVRFFKKSQITVSNLKYAQIIGDIIYDDYRTNFKKNDLDFGVYMANNFNTFNLGTAYYHSLEKEHGQILKVSDYDFRWPRNSVDYVVCTVNAYRPAIENDCLAKLDRRDERKVILMRSMIIDDKFYIIYRASELK